MVVKKTLDMTGLKEQIILVYLKDICHNTPKAVILKVVSSNVTKETLQNMVF
jgi:hypothetical protein